MANYAAQPQRDSSSNLYQCRWRAFASWATEHEFDPTTPSLNELAEYFIHLFEVKNLRPKTIAVHRAAIASVLKFASLDFDPSSSFVITNIFKTFENLRPRVVRIVPAWDLELVIKQLLKPPFTDISGKSDNLIPLPWLTRKLAFLLALASGARASELHALSRASPLLTISEIPNNGSILSLKPYPGFFAKNQCPNDPPPAWTVPSLQHLFSEDDPDRMLCPVRLTKIYLDRTKQIVGNRQRLFIHPNPKVNDIRSSHISHWIVDVITEAYERSDASTSDVHPRAHEVRALAHSWAYFNNTTLSEVLESARWKSRSSFTGHYL